MRSPGGRQKLGKNITPSEDLEATCRVLQAFGAIVETVSHEDGRLTVAVTGGLRPQTGSLRADCGESGSTVRFLIPVGLLTGMKITYTGRGRLPERPLDPFLKYFRQQENCLYKGEDSLPLTVKGRLKGGDLRTAGKCKFSVFLRGY